MTEIAVTQRSAGRAALRGDWRLILVMIVFLLCYSAVGLQMAHLAGTEPSEPTLGRGDAASRPVRAEIVDRNGELLAANLPAWSLYAHPKDIKDPVAVARDLAGIFPDLDQTEVLRDLTDGRRFVWIKRPISPREKQAVHDLGWPGLHFGTREIRLYPAGRTAAHIMGGVTATVEAVRFAEFEGSAGVEAHFDARLAEPAMANEPLRLSIDVRLQQAMRQILTVGMADLTAKGAAGVLMKADTGEILAMVSLPDFDPNAARKPHDGPPHTHPRFNRAAQGRYELGSTFKVLTAAMALETGVARIDTMLETPPELRFGKHRIGESHRMPLQMTLAEVVIDSSNVGTAKLAMLVRTPRFKSYLEQLGFFQRSGIQLPEASVPLTHDRWTDLSTVTVSYGHGLAASPVHLAAAYATIANGGVRVYPTLIAGQVRTGERVFSEGVSRQMLDIMRAVVTDGTAKRAEVPGYQVGGKTGTANKAVAGGYDERRVISTFASVFPTDDPEYVLVVSLDEPTDRSGPKPSRVAGRTAVPVARNIIARIAPILGMRPRVIPTTAFAGIETALE
ncbi:MAG: penicillin-binding protein 2 [Pseudomonadota bacterium]